MYTVYKTVNLVNGKFYIGVHKTENPMDDYLGSGKLLKRAIEKYGRENFRKEIVLLAEDACDAFRKEAELVTKEVIESDLSYNLKLGGEGGFDFINSSPNVSESRKRGLVKTMLTSERVKSDPAFSRTIEELKNASSMRTREQVLAGSRSWIGRKHSEETKEKMRAARKRNNAV